MPGGKGKIRPEDGKQFSSTYKPALKWTEEAALRLADDLLKWMKEKDENIFFDDFLYLSCDESKYPGKIYPDLLGYLAKKHTSFLERLEQARNIEKIKLKKYGAFDKLNASIVKFLLSAEYGLREKSEVDQTTTIIEQPLFTDETDDSDD
jgi:hypothetical protein